MENSVRLQHPFPNIGGLVLIFSVFPNNQLVLKELCIFSVILLLFAVIEAKGEEQNKDFTLPRAEESGNNLSTMGSLFVKKILLKGNTVYSSSELSHITQAYENRTISAEMLQELRLALTSYYVDHGYINSGVVIPDQKVEAGVVHLWVMEGRLSKALVTGTRTLDKGYIRQGLDQVILTGERPLNVFVLQQNLRLLEDDPHINTLHARVIPGRKKGEAMLHIKVEEAPRHTAVLHMDNHGSPGTGSMGAEVELNHGSLSGRGDDIFAAYRKTKGVDNCRLKYTLPVNRRQTKLTVQLDRSRTRVVSEPFSSLDITGESGGESLVLNHLFHRSLSTDFSAGVQMERRFSKTFYQGRNFSYGDGAVEGESRVSVLRFIQQWQHRTLNQVVAFGSTLSFGVDCLGATFSDREPDGSFFSWFGQFHWMRRVSLFDSRISLRLFAQMTDDPLLSMEKLVLGGGETLRGYREDSFSGDQGGAASLEWQILVGRLPISRISTNSTDGSIYLIPFFDYGRLSNINRKIHDPGRVYSAGMGVRWKVGKGLQAELFWGKALNPVERERDYDIQDDGVHFRVTAKLL